MAPALLLNESSSPFSTPDTSATPPISYQSPMSTTSWRHRSRQSPLLRRSVKSPPLWLTRAEGSWLSVTDGTKNWKIFDASGGAGVSNIGHGDKRVHDAIKRQEETGVAYAASMSFDTEAAWEFANHLLESTGDEMAEVVFYSSGNVTDIAIEIRNLTMGRVRGCRSGTEVNIPVSFQVQAGTATRTSMVHRS